MRTKQFACLTLAALAAVGVSLAAEEARAPASRDDGSALSAIWQERHAKLRDGLTDQRVDLLLIGDSITHFFEPSPFWEHDGARVWQHYYAPRNAYNLGIGGDTTEHLLWRVRHSDLERISPKVAVLNIGTNNHQVHRVDETVDRIQEIAFELRRRLPETEVLVLGLFPRGATVEDPGRRFVDAVNQGLAGFSEDHDGIHYLDISGEFLAEDGTLPEALIPDGLHPNENGYRVWAAAMEPMLARLLGVAEREPPE